MKTVDFLHEVDPNKSGGKGKHLITLSVNDFPVPLGFVITTDAYSLFKHEARMPESIKSEIEVCYNKLIDITGNRVVAVRSSASAEDTATSSFAGQYDTYLNVNGLDELLERVVDCWHSLFSERSVFYRKKMNIPDDHLTMAVVVQTMLAPKSAGVLFTANPYTMDKNVMLAEASWGCGESVVSGSVTPDYFEIKNNDSFEIITKITGSKEALPDNSTEILAEHQTTFCIAENQLKELCKIGKKIEVLFLKPQDIEWALEDDGTISILQSRPITKFNQAQTTEVPGNSRS